MSTPIASSGQNVDPFGRASPTCFEDTSHKTRRRASRSPITERSKHLAGPSLAIRGIYAIAFNMAANLYDIRGSRVCELKSGIVRLLKGSPRWKFRLHQRWRKQHQEDYPKDLISSMVFRQSVIVCTILSAYEALAQLSLRRCLQRCMLSEARQVSGATAKTNQGYNLSTLNFVRG